MEPTDLTKQVEKPMSIDSQQPSMNLLPAACMAIGLLIAMPVAHAQTLGGASGTARVKSIMMRKQ